MEDAGWALPDWEEYSEASASHFGDWSDVEADVSLDTASSVASTEHQRVYRLQRERGGFADNTRDLAELHALYAKRRREESEAGAASVRSSRSWLPAPCTSPRVDEKPVKRVESELLEQQSEISAELQAVRRQLSDFQDKWKKTVEARGGEDSTDTPTVASSWSSPGRGVVQDVKGEAVAVQTEEDEREEAVKQWLLLLTQKLNALARKYLHEPTQDFQAAMEHLDGLRVSDNSEEKNGEDNRPTAADLLLSSWHVGRALKTVVPLEMAEQFLELEHAIASLDASVEEHERRQMANFERAIKQVQGYHHERLQRVVDESLAEVKLVRGRYKKTQAKLDDELREANKEAERWKQTAAESEHRKKLDREALEFQYSTAKEQYDHACKRYEDDVARLKGQMESMRTDRQDVVSQNRDTDNVILQAKERAEELEKQLQALKRQQERAKELHDREMRVLRDTVRQLRESSNKMEAQHSDEKQVLTDRLEQLKAAHQDEMKAMESRVRGETEQRLLQERLPEQIEVLEKRHKEIIGALQTDYKRTVAQLTAQLEELRSQSPSVCTIETQTDLPAAATGDTRDSSDSNAKIGELTRRCRALEKLLDKKFEDTPMSLSSSQRCESCHSDRAMSPTGSVFSGRHELSVSRSSSLRSDTSSIRRASGKSRALARVLLGSSRASLDHKAAFTDETTLATDEATLGAHDMWDSASFTSIDSMEDLRSLASQRTTPRPATQRMKSTQEILNLVRQLKHAAGSPMDLRPREPDPEITPKQKFARDPPSWSAKSRVVGDGAPVTSGVCKFDDLLTDTARPGAA